MARIGGRKFTKWRPRRDLNKKQKKEVGTITKNVISSRSQHKFTGGASNALSLGNASFPVAKFNSPLVPQLALSNNFASNPLTELDDIPRGDDVFERIGDQIRLKKLYLKVFANLNLTPLEAQYSLFRCRYVAVMLKRGFPVSSTDIFVPGAAGSHYITCPMKKKFVRKTLIDKTFKLHRQNDWTFKQDKIIKLDLPFSWEDNVDNRGYAKLAHYFICESQTGTEIDNVEVNASFVWEYTNY